jgi:hypothetical protein
MEWQGGDRQIAKRTDKRRSNALLRIKKGTGVGAQESRKVRMEKKRKREKK